VGENFQLKPKLYPAINGNESLLYGSASLAKVDVYSGGLLVSYTKYILYGPRADSEYQFRPASS